MNGLPYYKAYPRDFIEGTIGMPFETKCAYRVILDLIYMQGGRLPDDARYISGLLGCSVRKWNAIRSDLIAAGKINVSGEFLANYRADKELETLAKLQDTKRENRIGASKNKGLQKRPSDDTEPEPDTERKKEPPLSPKVDRFDDFWAIVPRKVGKGSAQKAWAKACKIAPPETIIEGMRRYASERDGKDPQYTAHPASWLNAQRWTDEAPASSQNFHDMIAQALEAPSNAISGPRENDHRPTQRLSAPLQAPGSSGPGRIADGTPQHGRGDERAYAGIIRPKRFGGTDY